MNPILYVKRLWLKCLIRTAQNIAIRADLRGNMERADEHYAVANVIARELP